MALDKSRILSELGSVMNQLQSADCGCMGKMFSPGQGGCGGGGAMGHPLPTCGGCRRGCCQGHGMPMQHSMPGAGEPYAMNEGGMSGGAIGPDGGMIGGMHGGMSSGMSRGMSGGMPRGMHGGMHGGMQGGMSGGMPGGMSGGMPGGMSGGMPGGMSGGMPGGMSGGMPGGMHGGMSRGGMPGGMSGGMQGGMYGGMPGGMSDGMPGEMSDGMPGGMSGGMPGGMSGGMPGRMYEGKRNGMQPGGMFGGINMAQNAPRLYADTYSYLNQNLMQPVVQDVYNELRTITPENTVPTNPLAAQMGLGQSGGNPGGNPGGMGGQMTSGGMDMGGAASNPMGGHNMPQMNGMGANIMKMMMSGGGGKPKVGQMQDMGMSGMNQGGAPNEGNMGGMHVNQTMGQADPATMMSPPTQYVNQEYTVNAMQQGNMAPQGNPMTPNAMQQGNVLPQQGNVMTGNAAGMMKVRGQQSPYGVHSAGIKKFNEMFPGVIQGDLDFDPMSIAVQMNPANQKKAAMDSITKLMNGKKGQAMMQPSLTGMNAASQQQLNPQGQLQQIQGQQQMIPGQQQMIPGQQQMISGQQQITPGQQQMIPASQGGQQPIQGQQQMVPGEQQIVPGQQQLIPGQQQQVYTTLTEAPNMNQQQKQEQEYQQREHKQEISPVTKDFIIGGIPVETPQYEYNTIGQPVHFLPVNNKHEKLFPALPQTIDGKTYGDMNGLGVKNTLSKTAIAGSIPIGTAASRSQLKHIYRQYKASHSATQQSIRPLVMPQVCSASLGNIKMRSTNADAAPGEEVAAGDTIANNPGAYKPKLETLTEQVRSTPHANTPKGDAEERVLAEKKGRNGLQGLSFGTYHSTSGWSLHG